MSGVLDRTGRRYGRLVVVQFAGTDKHQTALWKCVCDCGSITVVDGQSLRSGNTKSCGCLRKDVARNFKTVHGLTMGHDGKETRPFRIWCNLRRRCLEPDYPDYKNYGGRGVTVCKEWLEYPAFYAWAMANGYRDHLTIERVNNDTGYSPENCIWVPRAQQARNRRNNTRITYQGESKTIVEWAERFGMRGYILSGRLRRGWTIERAFTTPVAARKAG